MSSRCKSKPQHYGSDIHRLLLVAETGQKADVLTYTSGHLGPRSLNQSQPCAETKQCFWKMSESLEETPTPLALQRRQTKISACVKKKEGEKYASEFTSGTTLVESGILKSSQDQATDYLSHEGTREDKTLSKTDHSSSESLPLKKQNNSSSDLEESSHVNYSHSDGMNNTSQRKMKQQFGREVVASENLLAGIDVAKTHERKLKQEVKKLAAERRPNRDRLAVFSDVFDDVCEGSPVFGRILREIKTEYDLYVNHLMTSHSANPNMAPKAAPPDPGALKVKELELEEAEKEVYKLEQEAKRALEENKWARSKLQNIQATKSPEDTDLTCLQDAASGCIDCVQVRRLQVLSVWKEIQRLEDEMKNKMVSTVITKTTERSIKDKKIELVKLIASNERLRSINKDLEDKINRVLNREKASGTIRRMLWDEIHGDLQTGNE